MNGFRLSPEQRRRLASHRDAMLRVTLRGRIDDDAIARVAARHEALRTRYEAPEGLTEPLQVIGSAPTMAARRSDSGVEIAMPALSADVASMRILARELRGAGTADAPPQYVQFSEWSNEVAGNAAYWSGRTFENVAWQPSSDKFTRVRQEPIDADAAVAAMAALLARVTRQRRVAIAVAVDGRAWEELAGIIGVVERVVPIAVNVNLKASLETLRRDVGAQRQAAAERADEFDGELPNVLVADYDLSDVAEIAELELPPPGVPMALRIVRFADRTELRWDGISPALADAFAMLFDGRADVPLASLPLLDGTAQQAVTTINHTACTWLDGLLPTWLARAAREHANAVAVRSGDIEHTFAELDAVSNAVARRVRQAGCGTESVVAIRMAHSFELVAAVIGVLKAGAAFLPIDPSHPEERIAFMLEDARASLVLRDSDGLGGGDFAPARVQPQQLAYVLYTSGSTGRPKGVMVTHEGLANYLRWAIDAYEVGGGDGAPLHSSIAFDLTITSLFAPLLAGKPVTIARDATTSVESLARVLADGREQSLVKLTPAHARLLAAQTPGRTRVLVLGGEALSADDVAWWREHAPATRIVNEYGPTETVVGCCVLDRAAGEIGNGGIPIGRPIANTRLYVVDEARHLVPRGVPGDLLIGGAGVARGYLGRPELTAERFVPDPFSEIPGARLYRSGDRVVLRDDDILDYLGRIDRQLKLHGHRVEAGEIEAVLREQPGVRDAVVDLRDERLLAWIVGEAEPAALRDRLGARLPQFMVPSAIGVVDAFPLTGNGKIDRAALPDPEGATHAATAPRTEAEEMLAGIWCGVLGLERVGIDDNYFALGGNSIRSLQVVAQARQRGLDVTVDDLFRCQTIRELAARLDSRARISEETLTREPFALVGDDDRRRMADEIVDAYPLSRLQAGMVYHRQLQPESAIYHDMCGYEVRAPFDEPALRAAVRAAAARHPMLRTSFDLARFSEPLQLVHATVGDPLRIVDLRHLDRDAQQRELDAFVDREKAADFDLTVPPLLRFVVHRRTDDTFFFWISFHHAILDGWSDVSLLIEIAASYLGEAPRPPLRALYRDFIELERRALADERSRAFWTAEIRERAGLRLPRKGTPDRAARRGSRFHPVAVPQETADALRALAAALAVPLKSVLLAAHMKLLSRVQGPRPLTMLAAVGRPETADGDKVLGLHLNSTPLRVVNEGETWRGLVRATFEAERRTLPHRRFPMAEMQHIAGVDRISETAFYYTHYYNLHDLDRYAGFALLGRHTYEETSFTLVTHFSQRPQTGELIAGFYYDRNELAAAQIEAMAGELAGILEAMAQTPGAPHRAEQVPAFFKALPQAPVHALFEAQAARTPEAVAIESDGVTVTYGELNARANRMARSLRRHGLTAEGVTPVVMDRSAEAIVALLAVLKAGGAYLPVAPDTAPERMRTMLQAATGPVVTRELVDTADGDDANLDVDVDPEQLAYVLYTSGSTGEPKGVAVPHRAVVRLVIDADYVALGPGETLLQFAPLAFDAATFEIWGALLRGARLVIAPAGPLSLEALGSVIRDAGVTTLWLTAGLFHQMIDERSDDLRGVRQLLAGGDVLSPEHVRRARERLPRTRLVNGYGPTEATTFALTHDIVDTTGASVPIGAPITNTTTHIEDGELWIGGTGLARGYHRRPDLTAERFVPDPHGHGGRVYRSGDRVRQREDGALELLGRIDRQVKIRGFRVEPAEIESVLRRHPGVRDAAIRVCDQRLIAYVIGDADQAALRAHAQAFLLDAMVPSAFIAMDEFPRTANGKLDRAALPVETRDDRAVRPPRTAVEELLTDIWRDVLGVERVGIDDDFFAIGGHSLLATQAVSRVRAALDISVPLRQLFEAPTVARFAEAIAGRQRDPLPPIERVAGDIAPLSLAQMRIWFVEQVTQGRAPWTIPFAARLHGPLNRARLDSALEQLVQRHDVLRTRIVDIDEVAMQRIDDAVALETPLFRVRVERVAEEEHELHFTIHHIICDGWSIGVLLRDLAALYAGHTLAPIPIRYLDYAAWQRRQVAEGALDADVEWWRERLAGAANEPLVAHDHNESGDVTHQGARHVAVIPPDVTRALHALSRAEGATLFMTLLAAYAVLLSRHSGRTDLTIGTDVANRLHAATEDVVGFFVNLLALRLDVSGEPSFPELLRRVRAACLDAYAHHEAPFERVAAAVGGDREAARNPLFRTLLVLQNAPLPLALGDVAVEPIDVESGTTPLELMVSVREERGALICAWSYRSDLYRLSTIASLAAQFETLLSAIAVEPVRPISELPLFDEAAVGFEAASLSRAEQEALLLAMRGIE